MYYSSGNYEAFARPRKPAGVENKTAWFVGSGLASLAGAAFLVRDGHMPGERITILEQQAIAGGALDGLDVPEKGFVIRGGREMEDHFECLWDLFRSIPSLEIEGASVLDEFYWLNKDDPNYSLQRATVDQGEDARTDGLFTLNEVECMGNCASAPMVQINDDNYEDLDYDRMLAILDALANGEEVKAGTQEPGRHTVEPVGEPTTLKDMVASNHDYRGEW